MSAFHLQDGLWFCPQAHGDVRIVRTTDGNAPDAQNPMGTNVAFELLVSRSQLASVMAATCARGYTTQTFFDAYAFLQEPKPSTP